MHTIMVLGGGFGLLGLCLLVGRALSGPAGVATAALIFMPLWLLGAAVNMYVGVSKAGYSVADELPIFLVVFGVPVAAALLIWWKVR